MVSVNLSSEIMVNRLARTYTPVDIVRDIELHNIVANVGVVVAGSSDFYKSEQFTINKF